jgi:hypothetical protein
MAKWGILLYYFRLYLSEHKTAVEKLVRPEFLCLVKTEREIEELIRLLRQ